MNYTKRALAFASLASVLAFTACKKDETSTTTTADPVKLTVTVNPDGIVSFPKGEGVILHIVATGSANNNLKSLVKSGEFTINGNTQTDAETVTLTGTSYETYDTIIFTENDATIKLTATLTGVSGDPVVVGPLIYMTNSIQKTTTQLGNQADTKAKFFSAKNNASYFLADVKSGAVKSADLDFAYCTRSTANGGNKLIAPSSDDATAIYADQWAEATEKITTWSTRNNTGFIKVNSKINLAAFNNDALDTDSLIEVAKTVGEPSNPSVSVADGDLYLFRTVRGTAAHPVYFFGIVYVAVQTGSVNGSGVAQAGDATLIMRFQREK